MPYGKGLKPCYGERTAYKQMGMKKKKVQAHGAYGACVEAGWEHRDRCLSSASIGEEGGRAGAPVLSYLEVMP